MHEAKNTARALVRIGYDGTVHKLFRAKDAEQRFANEVKVLRYLEQRGCDFVPRVISADPATLELVTTNCGARVEQMDDQRLQELFAELQQFGVQHDDPFLRNVTYRARDGRFCIIDFEFATILDHPSLPALADEPTATQAASPQSAPLLLRWSGATDIGKFRPNNEDAFLGVSFNREDLYFLGRLGEAQARGMDFIFAVSDGMGGERSGEFASKFTLDNVTRVLPRRFQLAPDARRTGTVACLEEMFHGIHRQLISLGESYTASRGMGATLTLAWYVGGWIVFGHIGDSRLYHLPKDGPLRQLTDDHTHVGWLRKAGQLNEREARFHPRKNVLTQSLGSGNQFVHPQFGEVCCAPGDRFLLCTDGIVEGLWDRGLEEVLRSPASDGASLTPAQRLVQLAVDESGRDNATAVVVEVHAT